MSFLSHSRGCAVWLVGVLSCAACLAGAGPIEATGMWPDTNEKSASLTPEAYAEPLSPAAFDPLAASGSSAGALTKGPAEALLPRRKSMPQALFIGCATQAGTVPICEFSDENLTVRIPVDGALPEPLAMFLLELPPFTPVSVTVEMPLTDAEQFPKLIAISRRSAVGADPVMDEIPSKIPG